jgi:hypothetical protein
MAKTPSHITTMLLTILLFAAPAMAGSWSLGVSGGWSDSLLEGPRKDDMRLAEVQAVYAFTKPLTDGALSLSVELEMSLGAFTLHGEHAVIGSVSPMLRVALFHRISATLQAGLGGMSESRFGATDLGGMLFYRLGPGLWWQVTDRVMIGYRLIHQSNGYTFPPNHGINFHLLSFRWRLGR